MESSGYSQSFNGSTKERHTSPNTKTYGVKINHIPKLITEQSLRNRFSQCGEISSVFYRLGDRENYAFINYISLEAATAAANVRDIDDCVVSVKLQGSNNEKGGGPQALTAVPRALTVLPRALTVIVQPKEAINGTNNNDLPDYSPEEVSNVEKFSFAIAPSPAPTAGNSPSPTASAPKVAIAPGGTLTAPLFAIVPPGCSASVSSVAMAPPRPAVAFASTAAPLLCSFAATDKQSIFAPSIGTINVKDEPHAAKTERRFSLQHIGQPEAEGRRIGEGEHDAAATIMSPAPRELFRGSTVPRVSQSRYRYHANRMPYSRNNSAPIPTSNPAGTFKISGQQRSREEITHRETVTVSDNLVAQIVNSYYVHKVKDEYGVAIDRKELVFAVSGKLSAAKGAAQRLGSFGEQARLGIVKQACPLKSHHLPLFDEDLAAKLVELQEAHCVQIKVVTRSDLKSTDQFCRAMKETFSSKEATLTSSLSDYLTTVHSCKWYEVIMGAVQKVDNELPDDLNEILNLSYAPGHMVNLLYSDSELSVDFSNMTLTMKQSCTNIKSVPSCWYRVDDDFGLIELDKTQSEAIEAFHLYGTPILIDEKSYSVDLERMILIENQSRGETPIQRVPPAKCSYGLYPPSVVVFLLCGLKDNVPKVAAGLQALVSEHIVERKLPLTGTEVINNALFSKARQYCLNVSRHRDKLVFKGSLEYIEKVMFLVQNFYFELLSKNTALPQNWEEMKEKVELKPVPHSSDEFKQVLFLLHKTHRPSQVVRLERIQNQWLWDRYVFAKQRMAEKNGGEVNEKELFHGTSKTPPETVYKSEQGFDFRFSDKGMWGTGAYFAVNASYSDKYAYHEGTLKQLLVALVLTGDSISTKPDNTLKKPPLKKGVTGSTFKDERYDSVTGTTGGSQIYVVYDHDKAYPAYLLTYK